MRGIIVASMLLAAPAMAQQPTYTPTSEVLLHQALSCESVASNQIATLQKQVADLTKERDSLKATSASTQTAPPK